MLGSRNNAGLSAENVRGALWKDNRTITHPMTEPHIEGSNEIASKPFCPQQCEKWGGGKDDVEGGGGETKEVNEEDGA
jgi:hypothetical protein